MKFTLEELELLLQSLWVATTALTIFNENTADLEKLIEDFTIEKSKMMREAEEKSSEQIGHCHTA